MDRFEKTNAEFEAAIAECRDMFSKKLHDYKASWRILRPSSLTDQLFIKAKRIRSLEIKQESLVGEGIRPEFVALINYGIVGLIQLEKGFADTVDMDNEAAMALYDHYAHEALELMKRKNHDYDEAWRGMRVSSYTDLILTKIERIKEIENLSGKTLVSEGDDANYMDIINYLLLAVVFILSGFVKAVDPLGTLYKMQDYLLAMNLGGWLPDMAILAFAVALATLEFCLGIFMLFAIRRRLTSRAIVIVLTIMTPLTLWLALANPIDDCGCFGDALVLTNWQTFLKNVILLAAAIAVARWPMEMFRFVSRSNQWIVINYSVLFTLIISGWSLYDRPQFDFRPYHIGTDLKAGWNSMMEGNESPFADFFIERTDDGEDITEQVLNDKGYTFLLIAPWLEKADDSQLDLINQIYEYAKEYDYQFYGLTATGQDGIEQWRDMTGAEYPFCQTDGTVLKTIIRSNPGLLLLKDGIIIQKWSHNRLPDEYDLTEPLAQLKIGSLSVDAMPRRIAEIMLWFVLPLALLTITDRLWMWSKWIRRQHNSNTFINKETKMRKKIVAGNWKMNMNLQDGIALAKELNETLKAEKPNCGVVISSSTRTSSVWVLRTAQTRRRVLSQVK